MKFTKLFGLFLVTSLFIGCSNAQEENSSTGPTAEQTSETLIKLVDKTEFQKRMEQEDVQLVDVRTPGEVAKGKIGNATNMNFHDGSFKSQLATLDKTRPVLVYCAAGGRSAKAVSMMKAMGFSEIYELDGGYRAWMR